MKSHMIVKNRTFLIVASLAALILATNWLLNLSAVSFALTSLLLALATILLIRKIFKTGANLTSWRASEQAGKQFTPALIAKKASVVKQATRSYYYSRIEIARVLRAALECRFGDQSETSLPRSASRENTRNELARLLGRNERVMEILDPSEDKCRRRWFHARSSQEEEEYLSDLEETIRILNERGSG